MTPTATDGRPSWLLPEHELPHVPQPVPRWTNHFLSYAYDGDARIGFWTHITFRPDPTPVWEEVVAVALPDGDFLVSKSVATGEVEGEDLRVNGVRFRRDEPFRRATKRFIGGAQRVSAEALRAGPLVDGPYVPVDLQLDCTMLGPPWDLGREVLDQSWGSGHIEQHLTFIGSITIDGTTTALSGTGLNEQSWGPRDYAGMGQTFWSQAQFPASKRGFMVIHVTGIGGGPEFSHAVVTEGDVVRPAEIVEATPVARDGDSSGVGRPYRLRLRVGDTDHVIEAEPFQQLSLSCLGPAELAFGRHRPPVANHHETECFSRFTWDGEVGYGISDWTVDLTVNNDEEQ